MQPITSLNASNAVNSIDVKQATCQKLAIPFPPHEREYSKLNWHEKAVYPVDIAEQLLEEKLPNFWIQNRLDDLGENIKSLFSPLKEFNTLLESAGQGAWYIQLALLPVKAARNIACLLYAIVKTALYAAVHPLKAATKFARLLIHLLVALTKPETWSKIGIGIAGGSCGQCAVTGNLLGLIGIAVGTAMTLGGLTAGAIKAALEAESGLRLKAARQNLILQAKELPETFFTAFFMGLMFGAMQKASSASQACPSSTQPQLRPIHQYQQHNLQSPIAETSREGINFNPLIEKLKEMTEAAKTTPLTPLTPEQLQHFNAEFALLQANRYERYVAEFMKSMPKNVAEAFAREIVFMV